MKIKSLQNGEINMLFTDIGKSCPSCKFLTFQINMPFDAIRDNIVLAKIS